MDKRHQDTEGLLSPLLARWRLRAVVREIRQRDHILDCGCGSGRLALMLDQSQTYVGFDRVTPPQISNGDNRIRFIEGDITDRNDLMKVKTSLPYDVIVMAALLEHFADPVHLLESLTPLLAPGGRFIVTTPHPRIKTIHDFGSGVGLFARDASDEHEVLLDQHALTAVMDRAQLSILRYATFQLGMNQLCVAMRSSDHADAD